MILRVCVCFSLILGLSSGCGGPTPSGQTPSPIDPAYKDVNTLTPGGAGVFGAGDVEVVSRVEARVDPRSVTDKVRIAETETVMEKVTRIQADVFAPHPPEFWIKISVFSRENYPRHAVLYETTVFVDNEEVGKFAFVGGPNLTEPHDYPFNLFQFTNGVPETALVHARTRLTLYKDTDPTTFTPETAPPAEEVSKASVLSNSLRIDFRQ